MKNRNNPAYHHNSATTRKVGFLGNKFWIRSLQSCCQQIQSDGIPKTKFFNICSQLVGVAWAWHGRGMGGVGVKSFVQEVLTDCADLCPFLCEQLWARMTAAFSPRSKCLFDWKQLQWSTFTCKRVAKPKRNEKRALIFTADYLSHGCLCNYWTHKKSFVWHGTVKRD